jgi:hypothetical protein
MESEDSLLGIPRYVELVLPVAPALVTPDAAADGRRIPPGDGIGGARVSLLNNGKANALELLQSLQELLTSNWSMTPGITVHKPTNGPLNQGALNAITDASDLVLVASAD